MKIGVPLMMSWTLSGVESYWNMYSKELRSVCEGTIGGDLIYFLRVKRSPGDQQLAIPVYFQLHGVSGMKLPLRKKNVDVSLSNSNPYPRMCAVYLLIISFTRMIHLLQVMWWLVFIVNWTEFRITMETCLWTCLWCISREAHLECRQHHTMGWGPGLNTKKKVS